MQFSITYGAAAVFEAGLYQALAERRPVDVAVGEGRKAVDLELPGTVEWGIPVLYLRSPNGDLFDVEAGPPRPKAPPPELDERYRKALELYFDQQMEQARAFLEEIIDEAPDYPGAYEKLEVARKIATWENEARLLRQAGRWQEVLITLDRVQGLMPEYTDLQGYKAWAERERQRDTPNRLYRQGLSALLPEEQEELSQLDGEYGLRNLAMELAESGRWETLHRLVAEGGDHQPWAKARRQMQNSYAGYLADLSLAWRHAEEVALQQSEQGKPVTSLVLFHITDIDFFGDPAMLGSL
jgi:tetratricopeptide (TPR) repeat protein